MKLREELLLNLSKQKQAEIERLKSINAETLEMLKALEWGGSEFNEDLCPHCSGMPKLGGHEDSCDLAALIRKASCDAK